MQVNVRPLFGPYLAPLLALCRATPALAHVGGLSASQFRREINAFCGSDVRGDIPVGEALCQLWLALCGKLGVTPLKS